MNLLPTPTELAQIAAPLLAARTEFYAQSDIAWAVSEAYLLWQEARRFCEELKQR